MSVLGRTPPRPDLRLPYGPLPDQFGQLWLPNHSSPSTSPTATPSLHPLLVFLHGGWWTATYGLDYANFLCAAMKALGVAVWSLEYRRVGNPGGGWPGTFQDVAAGFDHIAKLAEAYPLDITRIVAAGHSAGGHLAFWLAGRHHIPSASVLAQPQTDHPNQHLALRGVVALAGAVDLRLTLELGSILRYGNGPPAVRDLLGGSPKDVPERYAAADPGRLLPLGVPQALVQGSDDDQIPPTLPLRWADQARRQGDHVDLAIIPSADHFDVVDPESKAWAASRAAMLNLLLPAR